MKPLKQNEIFQNLSSFLKTRGIEIKDGSYAKGLQKSCSLLTDAINVSQHSWERARGEVDKSLGHLRQVIHEKTAPRSAAPPVSKPQPKAPAASKSKAPSAKSAKPRKAKK